MPRPRNTSQSTQPFACDAGSGGRRTSSEETYPLQTQPPHYTCNDQTESRAVDASAYDWVDSVLDWPEPVLSLQVAQEIMARPGSSGDWFSRFRRSGGL